MHDVSGNIRKEGKTRVENAGLTVSGQIAVVKTAELNITEKMTGLENVRLQISGKLTGVGQCGTENITESFECFFSQTQTYTVS